MLMGDKNAKRFDQLPPKDKSISPVHNSRPKSERAGHITSTTATATAAKQAYNNIHPQNVPGATDPDWKVTP